MRKIGELKGKPIIEGNPNEIKKNQIHYKESDGGITLSERKEDNTLSSVTSGSGSGEGGSSPKKGEYLYYKATANNANGVPILLAMADFRYIDWIYDDNYNKEKVYAESCVQISDEPIMKVRKDYFKILFSHDDRHGVTINFNDFLNDYTFEELLRLPYDMSKEEFDEILIPLTSEEIIEIENKIIIRDPAFN